MLKSRRTWVIVMCLALFPLWYWTAYPRGMAMAYFDHLRGHYEIRAYSDIYMGRGPTYQELLGTKYGVKVKNLGDPLAFSLEERFVAGYNSTSQRLLNEKFGSDIFEECCQEVEKWHPGGADW